MIEGGGAEVPQLLIARSTVEFPVEVFGGAWYTSPVQITYGL